MQTFVDEVAFVTREAREVAKRAHVNLMIDKFEDRDEVEIEARELNDNSGRGVIIIDVNPGAEVGVVAREVRSIIQPIYIANRP
jgi:hypothetical protein